MDDLSDFVNFYFNPMTTDPVHKAYPLPIKERILASDAWFLDMRAWLTNARMPYRMNEVITSEPDAIWCVEVMVTRKDAPIFKLFWC